MQPGSKTRVRRQHGGTSMVVAVIAVVLTMAGLIAWLLLKPSTQPQREPDGIIPSNASAVFSFFPSRLVNKSGLPDLLNEHLDAFGGMAMMIDPNQLDTLADFTKLGIREDKPFHLFFQPGTNGPRAGLVLPLINREAFEKGMKENLPGGFGDDILKQITEERGLRGIFQGPWPFVFAYDQNALVLLFEEGQLDEAPTNLGAALHELFDQEKSLLATDPTFANYVEANNDIGYWVKLETLPSLLGKSTSIDLEQLDGQLQGVNTLGMQFEPGMATLNLMLTGENRMPLRPVDQELLKTIPDDSVLVIAGGIDLKTAGERITSVLGESDGLLNQLNDEVPVDKLREIIQNLTRGENIDLDAQFTGDIAIALTDFELKKITKLPLVPLPLPDTLQLPAPKLHLAGSFKTKANADTEALVEQFKITESLGLEAFAREGVIHLASPDLRKSLEQNGTVPNSVAGPTRDQLATHGAALFLNFNRLSKILNKFPKQLGAALALAPLESLTVTLRSGDNADHAVIKVALNNKEINALRQMVEMGTNPPRVEDPVPDEVER